MADTPAPPRARRPYATPTLHAYGAVKDLTAGGSGAQAELKIEILNMCFVGMNAMRDVTLC